MTQRTFILSREQKELSLNRAQFRWPGISARGFRKVKSLIWVMETTGADSRTAEILAGKMHCSLSTYHEALVLAQQLGAISVTRESGGRSTFWIDWNRIDNAGPPRTQLKSDPSESDPSESEASEIGGVRQIERVNARTRATSIHECFMNVKPCHGDEDAICQAGSETMRQWWGRDQPLSKSDLLSPESIERLFTYAVNRGRFERTDLERLRFEALCLYCCRRGHIPGALLTRCVFGSDHVQYIATARDEDAARSRMRKRAQPAADPAVTDVARGLSLPVLTPASEPPRDTRTNAEKIRDLREWAEKHRESNP
jgi:hypothetical protein